MEKRKIAGGDKKKKICTFVGGKRGKGAKRYGLRFTSPACGVRREKKKKPRRGGRKRIGGRAFLCVMERGGGECGREEERKGTVQVHPSGDGGEETKGGRKEK